MSEPQIVPSAPLEPGIAIDNREDARIIVCPVCGKEFKARGRNRDRRIYCGRRCGNRAWVVRHPRVTRPAPKAQTAAPKPRPMPTAERRARLIVRLGRDGRHPLAELAAELGCSARLVATDVRALAAVLPLEREGGDVVARYLLLRLDESRPAAPPPLPGAILASSPSCLTMASADPEVGTRCSEYPASPSS